MTPQEIQDYLIGIAKGSTKSWTVRTNSGILALWGIAQIVGMSVAPEYAVPAVAIVNLLLRGRTKKPIRDL